RLSAPDRFGFVVEFGQRVGDRCGPTRHRRTCPFHLQFSLDVPGLLLPLGGLHAGVERNGPVQGHHRPSAEMATGSGLRGERVIVIGSGATAATLIPAIVKDCAHVTMLQRSPTFFRTGRNAIEIADELRKLQVDEAWIHEIVRRKILYEQSFFTRRSFTEPQKVKEELLAGVRAYLGSDYPIERDFTPSYRPWRQRIAFVPDGDFLQAIAAGQGSVVTDEIESFTGTGIQLKSGKTLDAASS